MNSALDLGIHNLQAAYAAGTLTCRQVIEEVLARIAAAGDDKVWISRVPDAELLAQAEALDARLSEIERLPLYGVPFAVKDNIDVAGMTTTAACPGFAYKAEASAEVVKRLTDAGAIVIGKTNLDQFATGLVGVRSPYGVPRNPFDADLYARRLQLGLGGRGLVGPGELRARHRHGRLGPRAGGLQQHRRAEADAGSAQQRGHCAGLRLARLRVGVRALLR